MGCTPIEEDYQNVSDYESDDDNPEDYQSPNVGSKRSIKDGDGEGVTEARSKPRKRTTRSNVWEYFTRLKEDYDRCLCNYCSNNFSCPTKSGTSNLNKHLITCKEYKIWQAGRDSSQVIINKGGHLQNQRVSEKVFREACNELLVLAELPLSFIESEAWKHFCDRVNLYHPHSRRTATRDIIDMFFKKKAELKDFIKISKQRVSLTTDIWVAQSTAHFVNAEWKLQKLIIGFKYVEDHKGSTISRTLLDCLEDWGIERVFCITVDNATANSSAIMNFHSEFSLRNSEAFVLDGDFMHMRCSGHIINLIVQDGLSKIDANVAAVRNAVTYVRSSTPRLQAFELKVDGGRVRKGSLPLDVKTRWNSTYLMLFKAMEYMDAFRKMEEQDKLYSDYFCEQLDGRRRMGPPLSSDWSEVERLVSFLHIFYNSTLVVSASNSVNSYKCYGEIVTIEKYLVTISDCGDEALKTKAQEMLLKFDKYWDGMKKINKMLIVAAVFDPKKKMAYAKMCFEKLYGKDSKESKELYGEVMVVLLALFTEYSNLENKGTRSVSSYQASQAFQTSQGTYSRSKATKKLDMVNNIVQYERMESCWEEMVQEIGATDSSDELGIYLKESIVNPKLLPGMEFDVLDWWNRNRGKYPTLSNIARDVLAMQVSSVASESAFITSGRILDPYRSCLTHFMIKVLMCTEQWLMNGIRASEKGLVTNAEIISELEMLDSLEKDFKCPIIQEEETD